MNREDVVKLFTAWKAAGLRPPAASTPEQAKQMIEAFLGQYKNISADELEALKNKLSHANYWPRFSDVDEVLAECRREITSTPKYNFGLYGKAKREKECEIILGRSLADGESWTMALAEKCAGRLFPDADGQFVEANRLILAVQQEFDFKCAVCAGLNHKECPFGGHEPYLRIDPETGLCVQYVDSQKCRKVYT